MKEKRGKKKERKKHFFFAFSFVVALLRCDTKKKKKKKRFDDIFDTNVCAKLRQVTRRAQKSADVAPHNCDQPR
jgi:hypothetical protein